MIIFGGEKRAVALMPTCSAAITAACHAPEDDTDAQLLFLKWGLFSSNGGGVHYSSLTAREGELPLRKLYTSEPPRSPPKIILSHIPSSGRILILEVQPYSEPPRRQAMGYRQDSGSKPALE